MEADRRYSVQEAAQYLKLSEGNVRGILRANALGSYEGGVLGSSIMAYEDTMRETVSVGSLLAEADIDTKIFSPSLFINDPEAGKLVEKLGSMSRVRVASSGRFIRKALEIKKEYIALQAKAKDDTLKARRLINRLGERLSKKTDPVSKKSGIVLEGMERLYKDLGIESDYRRTIDSNGGE